MVGAVELFLLDWRVRTFPHPVDLDGVAVVGIGDDALDALPTWGPASLDRAVYAPVLRNLVAAGARAIAMDVYFGDAASNPASDDDLATAIADAGNVVIVADAVARLVGSGEEEVTFTPPCERFASRAADVASPLLFRPDNVVRSIRLWQRDVADGSALPALAMAAVLVGGKEHSAPAFVRPKLLPIRWGESKSTVVMLPFEDVYAGRFDAALVRDRIVFVGLWHEMEDRLQTPIGPMSGVEIHARAAATLLGGNYLRILGDAVGLFTAIPLCIVIAIISIGRPAWLSWAISILLAALWTATSFALAAAYDIALPRTGTALSLLLVGPLLAAMQSTKALRSLSHLWPSWVTKEGEEVEVTVLVCDIVGYTEHSEAATAGQTMAMLNDFFAIVDETISTHRGILARRPGDAAIVFFRAEEGLPHHARRAIETAITLRGRLREHFRDTELGFGITLTTGIVSLGFVGTSPPEPQILGDPVNVAFRLQEQTRSRSEAIIADFPTATADAETAAMMRPLGEVEVPKRRAPVQIFAPTE